MKIINFLWRWMSSRSMTQLAAYALCMSVAPIVSRDGREFASWLLFIVGVMALLENRESK